MTAFDEASPIDAASERRTGQGINRLARLVPAVPPASLWNWAGPLLVTLFGGFLRFYRLADPHAVIFDETYYVPDAYSILRHGVELNHVSTVNGLLSRGDTNILRGGGEYVAHPPLGKVLMAGGDWLFGLTPFGWRFAVAVIGTVSILMTARITRRMTTSTLLGCVAGLLMALDGLELVLSRTAILDIFLMFWMLAAFGMLLIDRDVSGAQMARAMTDTVSLDGGGFRPGIRWRRVLAGVFLGCACATKWDGVWYIFAFGALAAAWDLSARRDTAYRAKMRAVPGMRNDLKWLPVSFGLVPIATYLASWSGWFASSQGYDRNWAALNGNHTPIWSALDSLYHYNRSMLGFGLNLRSHQGYVSEPWTWLVLSRPVSFFYAAPKTCGAASRAQEVLAIGTPAIWWASIPALLLCLWWWIGRRDWRAGTILLGVTAGWLPWYWFAWHDHRTEYYYYAVVFLPFLVMAITLCLGRIIGPARATPRRRVAGAVIAGAYVLLVLANFAYLYPLLTAQSIPYASWQQRIWFSSWI